MTNPSEHTGPVEVDTTVGPHSPAAGDASHSGNDVTEQVYRDRAAGVQQTEREAQQAPPPGQSESPSHPSLPPAD